VKPRTCRPVRLRWKKGLVRELRRRRAIRKLGGRCAECGEAREMVLEIHHVNFNGNLHRKKTGNLTAWVLREENPREGEFAVCLLCLNCHRVAHSKAA
jgi:ssDNA-binding Zn-finger/Zn-ribbon topoisomerase 1